MNIPHFNQCVTFALHVNCIKGDNLKETNLRVFEREVANPGTVFKALRKGGIIFPVVRQSLFGGSSEKACATYLISADEQCQEVSLYVAAADEVRVFPVDSFLQSWEAMNGRCVTAFPARDDTYQPKLLDLRHTPLPEDCAELLEAMAENVHDMWALERQSEGWTYGPQRDDEKLLSPDMVPYGELPDSERQYDRKVASDTLRLLTVLGYKVVKGGDIKM